MWYDLLLMKSSDNETARSLRHIQHKLDVRFDYNTTHMPVLGINISASYFTILAHLGS